MADDIAPEGSAPHGLRGMRANNRVQPEPAASPGHLRDADELPSSPEAPSSEPEELGLQSQVGRHGSMGGAIEDIRVLSKVKIFASAMKQHGDLAFLRPESLIPMTLSPPFHSVCYNAEPFPRLVSYVFRYETRWSRSSSEHVLAKCLGRGCGRFW